MFKAFSGAFSLALAFLVIKMIAPEVFDGLTELMVNVIKIINLVLEQNPTPENF